MPPPRQELLRLLAHKSFKLGEFKLSSGGTSDYYIDCRTTTLDARGSQLTGQVFLEEMRKHGWTPQAIGGLTMGADPIVVAVSVTSGELNGFLVRKAEKQHGTGQRIEGFRQKGAKVVIVDDVCTTGASTAQAIEAAREFGFEVVGVMCLVEREEAGGRPSVESCRRTKPMNSQPSAQPANSAASPQSRITRAAAARNIKSSFEFQVSSFEFASWKPAFNITTVHPKLETGNSKLCREQNFRQRPRTNDYRLLYDSNPRMD
jgi:orotate phosphoribosyltransferase